MIHENVNEFNKEMNELAEGINKAVAGIGSAFDDDEEQKKPDELEYAIYEDSKANKFVAMIEKNKNLTDEEKNNLLKNQEENLDAIAKMLENDKELQEREFDRILKERLDRRRRLKEKQHAKEIAKETA